MSEDELVVVPVIIAVVYKQKQKNRKKRRHWVKPWHSRLPERRVYKKLLSELQLENESDYKDHLRMATENFAEINSLVEQKTTMRNSIPSKPKLAIILRFFSTRE